ncbi:pre-rRNA-processing protein TSR1 homolog [Rhopilema esculentum]|uniref:pre-rRNA-processing protein TSR1 homolog n=1 Tax=Rhopilema esculentum TaxID=499914 RepID=UPI0031D26692
MAKVTGEQAVHKPGPLKQSNKAHKHGRHRTKSQLDNANRGRVSVKVVSKKSKSLGRLQKRLQAKQRRKSKLDEILEKKRGNIGKEEMPPHVVAVVPLDLACSVEAAINLLSGSDDSVVRTDNSHSTTLTSIKHRQRLTLLSPNIDDLDSVLNSGKVANTIVFLSSAQGSFHAHSEQIMTCLLAQGLPSTVHVIQGLKSVSEKKRSDAKKHIAKSLETWFPDEKLYALDSEMEASILLRHIANQKQRPVFYRDCRPFLLAEKVEFATHQNEDGQQSPLGTLKVTGYIRGHQLDVNKLIHIPGFGDFQMLQIEAPVDPHSLKLLKRRQQKDGNDGMPIDGETGELMEEDVKLIGKANPALQVTLESEVIPDPMDGEQAMLDDDLALVQEEKLSSQGSKTSKGKSRKRVPKGTSDYQAAWIVESGDEFDGSDDDDDDAHDDFDSDDEEHKKMMDSEEESEDEEDIDNSDAVSVSTNIPDSKYDQEMDLEEERRQLEIYRAERENEMFPDEMDTPLDIPARVRFQRYRGLKSFRSSPWDSKENLPYDYARIFQFQNFLRMKKRVMNEEVDGALPGWYVTVHIANVPKDVIEHAKGTFVIFGLLPHEHKMTVMHYVIKKHHSYTEPVKAKDHLVFHVGYRKFWNQPIFSQHTTGNKFKYERFLPKEGVAVASVYAPVMFPPAPVLVFSQDGNLVATGSVYKSNPDRIILKKIVLSGHPYKINKRSVVVRHMFFNREDIFWFKPVELRTKYGRHGHIKEALGTHGHMKCSFDGQLKQHDTICLSLYKRVFPKWSYNSNVISLDITKSRPQDEDDFSMI